MSKAQMFREFRNFQPKRFKYVFRPSLISLALLSQSVSWIGFLGVGCLVFCTTSFWAKYLIFIPWVEANNVLTPLQCFSPSAPNHTLALQKCMVSREWKKHPNLFASKQSTKNLPQWSRVCSPSSLSHALISSPTKAVCLDAVSGVLRKTINFFKH